MITGFTKRLLFVISVALVTLAALGLKEGGDNSAGKGPAGPPAVGKLSGDSYRFFINNINMPMSSSGVMADVNIAPTGTQGRIDGINFLYSGGFMMSGTYPTGGTWACAQASASRINNFKPGRTIPGSSDNPVVYVVDGDAAPFGQDWQDWSGAVALGADFYDGNKNGIYDPIDLNGNGKWEENEDRPDLLGDHTAWCVYSDAIPAAQRERFAGQGPVGIDIQQSVFGFKSAGLLGNMLFIRYRITNSGKYYSELDSVFFSVWADPDLGDAYDDLVGCDTVLNAGFVWNDGPDASFGGNPPCFLIDFFQGPVAYIPGVTFTDVNGNGVYDAGTDVPLTAANNVRGPALGVDTIPGAKNLGLHSFVNYVQSNPDRGDPNVVSEARSYTTGRLRTGGRLDPCTDTFGKVFGLPCTSVDPTYWYSGDPTFDPGYGWIYTTPGDLRQMQNTGPFVLKSNQPVDIVIAYIVARGSDARSSVALAKSISNFAQFIYDRNFKTAPPPPVVRPFIRTTDNSIELIWDTYEQMAYRNVSPAYDVRFEGFEVTMYNSNSTASSEGGRENAKVIARYDKADSIDNVLIEKPDGERLLLYQKGTQLDSLTYATQGVGRIRLVITSDPFTGAGLIKGRPYYFSITGYALNQAALTPVRPSARIGDYLLAGTAFIQNTQNVAVIINGDKGGIVPGIDFNNPYRVDEPAQQQSGASQGRIYVDEVQRDKETGHLYKFTFFQDKNSQAYSTFWRMEDATAGTVKLDSQKTHIDTADYAVPLIDGLRVRVVDAQAGTLTPTYSASSKWYVLPNPTGDFFSGVFYTGKDYPGTNTPLSYGDRKSSLKHVTDMRGVEIRFGPTQKAYRYVNAIGVLPAQRNRFEYAAGMALAAADTAGGKPIPPNFGKGYVDVPFQVWIKDPRYGEERQVNCAFMESRQGEIPDGAWDPGTKLDADGASRREYIIVFDTPYSPDTNIVYTGGSFDGTARWANILEGWTRPTQWTSAPSMSAADSARAADKWLSALFVVPLSRAFTDESQTDSLKWNAGETLTIPITYSYTDKDVFVYQSGGTGGTATTETKKAEFDKVNVFPNPLFAYNPGTSFRGLNPDDPYVTFSNLPEDVAIKIYSLAGTLLRELSTSDKRLGSSSPFLEWDLKNQAGLRVSSGMYIAIVSASGIGNKVLKFAVVMPQKQIQRY